MCVCVCFLLFHSVCRLVARFFFSPQNDDEDEDDDDDDDAEESHVLFKYKQGMSIKSLERRTKK